MGAQGLSSRAINGMFRKSLQGQTMPAVIDKACWHNPNADMETEEYKMLDRVPTFRKWTNDGRRAIGTREQGMFVRSDEFEATMSVKPRERKLDKTGQLQQNIDSIMSRAPQLHARLFVDQLVNGHQSVSTFGANATYDKADFFGSGHRGGQSNVFTANAANNAKPTAVEFEDLLIEAYVGIMGYLDEHDEPENEDATQFLIVAPTAMMGVVSQVLNNQVIQGVGGAIDNTVRNMRNVTFDVEFMPRLTSSWGGSNKTFALLRTDSPYRPFIRQTEEAIRLDEPLAEGSEHAFKNKDEWLFGARGIVGYGYGIWQHAARCRFQA